MDRQALSDQAVRRKADAAIARSEGRLWDALFCECMYFHFDRMAKGTPEKDVPIRAMLALGFPLIQLGFSPLVKKECTAKIVSWSLQDGTEESLRAILKQYQR